MLNRPPIPAPSMPPMRLAGVGCQVELRRSARAKRFSLKVSHTERAAILTLPNRGRVEEANAFLARHSDWLKKQLDRLPEPVPFEDGAIVPLRGTFHHLTFAGVRRDKSIVWVESADEGQRLPVPSGLQVAGDWPSAAGLRSGIELPRLFVCGGREYAARRLSDWLRAEVRKDLASSVAKHAKTLECAPKRLSIRDQSTRWGSCSTSGTLSFSWRLIFAPPFVLDYVAAHEVAHLREMNHGPRFWRLVRDACPGMQRARNWLKAYGAELHRFGACGFPEIA